MLNQDQLEQDEIEQEHTSISEVMESTQELTEHSMIEEIRHDERRKFVRRAARWHTKVTTKDKTVVQCKTRDVSEKGLSLSIPYDFNMNAIVIVDMFVVYKHIRKNIRVLGQVRHSSVAAEGYTIGIHIKDSPKRTTEFLKAYASKKI